MNGQDDLTVPDVLQVRMYLYGLIPLLIPLVVTQNPATLEETINEAKLVETGYAYIPTKEISLKTAPTTRINPTLREITPEVTKSKAAVRAPVNEIDALSEQLQKLTLNYANLTTALLAKTKEVKPRDRSDGNKKFTCFKCEKEGHMARECRSKNTRSKKVIQIKLTPTGLTTIVKPMTYNTPKERRIPQKVKVNTKFI